jgi:hypothetical protein
MLYRRELFAFLLASAVFFGLLITEVPAPASLRVPVITMADGPQPPPTPPKAVAYQRFAA